VVLQHADWVVAIGLVGLVLIARTALRWKSGRRRHFKVTVVVERDYEGPNADEDGEPGREQPRADETAPVRLADQDDGPPSP